MRTAIVLLSGGLDSATTLWLAREASDVLFALSFDYGQRHSHELSCAAQLARLAGASHRVIRLDLRAVGGSALTSEAPVPKDHDPYAPGIPATYVPARNTIFLAYALGLAEVLDADAIWLGVNAVDYSGYPDCRPEYLDAFRHLARLATRAGVEGHPVWIEAPLLRLTKQEIVATALRLGVPIDQTSSCYDPAPDGAPCHRCDSCQIRDAALRAAGVA